MQTKMACSPGECQEFIQASAQKDIRRKGEKSQKAQINQPRVTRNGVVMTTINSRCPMTKSSSYVTASTVPLVLEWIRTWISDMKLVTP